MSMSSQTSPTIIQRRLEALQALIETKQQADGSVLIGSLRRALHGDNTLKRALDAIARSREFRPKGRKARAFKLTSTQVSSVLEALKAAQDGAARSARSLPGLAGEVARTIRD